MESNSIVRRRLAARHASSTMLHVGLRTGLVLAGLVLSALAPLGAEASEGGRLAVPLVVEELRPPGHGGVDRNYDPVTVGIPLPEDFGLTSVDRLTLDGVSRCQFRPLGYWESGAIKWVLADFLASTEAGRPLEGIFLTLADEPVETPRPIGTESADEIVLDVGAMRVTFAREGTGLIRRVEMGERVLLEGEDAFALIASSVDGAPFPATVDSSAKVRLVENGPAKAVVRATGSHRSPSGEHLFDFTLELTAFYGNHFLRGEYTLRNASGESPAHIQHGGVSLVLDTTVESNPTYRFPRHDPPYSVSGDLDASGGAYYYVAANHSKQEGAYAVRRDWPNEGWVPPIEFDFGTGRYVEEGYRIVENGEVIVPQSRPDQYNEITYVDLSDGSGAGVTGTIRFGSRLWPISYEAKGDGTVEIGLFSRRTEHRFTVAYHTHETREFAIDFRTAAADGYLRSFKESYPLSGRVADIHWFNRCDVLTDKLVTLDEVNDFFAITGIDARLGHNNEPFYAVRFWDASQGGGNNQLDTTYHQLVRYLRTGESGALLRAKAWADYRSDQAIIHTDDWTYAPEHEDRFPQFHVGNGGEIMATSGNFFDNQHRHTRGLPLMYYLTGKERYLDAIFEDAELVTFNDRMELHYLNTRVQSVLIRLAMNSWRFLGEVEPIVSIRDRSGFSRDELLSKAEAYMRAILDARFDFSRACSGGPQPKGWSDEPGESRNDSRRFWFAGGDRIRNREPKFHLIAMFPDMLWNYDRLARHDDPNRSEVRARILDLEHYFWNFLFTDCPEDAHRASIGDFFVFLFDDECRIPEVPQCFEGDDFHPAYQMEAFAFDVTGDPVHLERGIRFMLGQHYGGDQLVWGNAYRTGFLNFVYHFMHHEWDDVGPVLDEVESVKAEEFPVAVRWNTDEESSGHVIYWTDLDHRRVMAREGRIGTRHVVPLEDLIPVREYKYRVASQDESGNWSLSRRRILGFDDFRSDTRDRYDVIRSGGAVVEHDLATKMLRMGGGPGSVAEISLTRREGDSIGFCSLDFLPDSIPESGSITIRLMEDEDDFYELDLYADASGGEALRLRKVMDGTTVRSSRRGGAPFGRDRLRTKLVFRPDAFGIKEGGAHGFFGFRTPVGQRMIEVRKIVIIVRGIHGRLDNVLVELG